MSPILFSILLALLLCPQISLAWIEYASQGIATLTHYSLPLDYIASCGCTPASTHYPTAALSQAAFGSSQAFGPSCGRCFNLTLLNTFESSPPFFPSVSKSIVVKVTDLCPMVSTWCSATASKSNPGGAYLNFDLAWPSTSIPDDFFPSNATLYGYTDFGVWNISYSMVSCDGDWTGAANSSALGAAKNLGNSVCCPADPLTFPNTTCGSYSDLNGIPPDATPGNSSATQTSLPLIYDSLVLSVLLSCLLLLIYTEGLY